MKLRLSGVLLGCLLTGRGSTENLSHAQETCGNMARPRALVYRGPEACAGCPETVGKLLEKSPSKFTVTYVGPDEDVDITEDSLSEVDVYAQPGGPDLDSAWSSLEEYAPLIRNFVSNGGRYMGFCLGAYLAGHSPGFGLLPSGADTDSEISQQGAQVSDEEDTVIQVDWTFKSDGDQHSAGQTARKRWVYFQDGAMINGLPAPKPTRRGRRDDNGSASSTAIWARYSRTGNVAASLTSFGQGWVALVGPHPEATEEWYSEKDITNPDGLRFDIGYDFVEATMQAGQEA